LALTIQNVMYSWGAGHYGALGFGDRENQHEPKHLDIKDHKD